MRRAADEGLTRDSVKRYQEKQMAEAILLGCDWHSEPAKWDQHLHRATVSMILSVVYGTPPIKSEQDRTIQLVNDFGNRITRAALPGAHLVESFPWMKHIPSWY
jgi:hypothetical protein